MRKYMCQNCGAINTKNVFRGASEDGSYLKCYRCGSTEIKRLENDEEESQ
ncbi:hypothetical protein J7J18_04355 [bacterium]|nr:hypothetical protein [bacterium]